eukprot:8757168-Pyramimonas_sp.AAC.1
MTGPKPSASGARAAKMVRRHTTAPHATRGRTRSRDEDDKRREKKKLTQRRSEAEDRARERQGH